MNMESEKKSETQPFPDSDSAHRRSRLGLIVLISTALILLGILVLPLLRDQNASLLPGTTAPDFTLTAYDGSEHTLSSYQGSVIVINFWASWCDPCQKEAALLEETSRLYSTDTVVFLGIAYTDTEAEALAYLAQYDITYPNGPDLGTRISSQYRVHGVPETYIVDPEGIIAAVRVGPFTEQAELEALILDAK